MSEPNSIVMSCFHLRNHLYRIQINVSYLTSYWGPRLQPQDDGGGVGANERVGESWRVDVSHPGDLKEWHYPEFHHQLHGAQWTHCFLQMELPRWVCRTHRSAPRDSSDTLLVKSELLEQETVANRKRNYSSLKVALQPCCCVCAYH